MSIGALRRLETEVGELLERHESARDLSEFAKYENDPVGFIRDVLGAEPWSAQVEIAESVRDNQLTVVQSMNAAGKDWLAARLALWWVYACRGLAICSGPSERQVKGIVFREIRSAFVRADLPGELFELALRVDRDENIGIVSFTGRDASSLQGWHGARILVLLTEGQGLEATVYESMHACAVGPDDRQLVVGNPLHPSGTFHALTRRDSWNSIRISAEQHPNIIEDRQVIPGGVSRAFVDRMAAEFGKNSSIYRSRVLGEFPDQSEYGLISRAWLERAAELHRDGEFRSEASNAIPIVSVDPARYGVDRTAVMVRRGPRIERIETWGQVSLTETADRLVTIFDEEGVYPRPGSRPGRQVARRGRVVIDEHGLGSGLLDQLREKGYKCTGFLGMKRMGGQYLNARAEAFWELRTLLENERIAIPWDPDLVDELLAVEWSTPSGPIQILPKDRIKELIGRSPDLADALSQAFAPYVPRVRKRFPFRI